VWPSLTFDECGRALEELHARWSALLETLTMERLAERIDYTTSTGDDYSSTIGDILTHVVNHASYHRGQIVHAIREAGGAPPMTDFIFYARGVRDR
jgi:uncharacterized damage-inducible protein DinB